MTKTPIANRAVKAKPSATPSRIQNNIRSSKAIVDQKIVANDFIHLAETEGLGLDDLPSGQVSVPLSFWLEHKSAIKQRGHQVAVQVGADEDPASLVNDLAEIDVIVLPFVAHVDGRGYSHAHKLRERFGFTKEIRAIGDVKFDQLRFLSRVGCSAFELPESENLESALLAFKELQEVYQPAADGAPLIFSRRRRVH